MAPFFAFAKQRCRAQKASVHRLLLEPLEERCVLSGLYPYDGTYTGTYTGNVTLNDSSTEAVSGPVAFTVTQNLVTATQPFPTDPNNDNGVLAEGAINFLCDNGDTTQGAAGIGFQGQITLTAGAASINGGSWAGDPLGNYQFGDGAWTASTATTPTAGTVTPNAPTFNKSLGGIDYSYQVNNGPLSQDVPIAFYWGSDSIGSATIGTPFFTDTAAVGTATGTVSDSIPTRNLLGAPANAKFLLMVTNPGDTANQKIAALPLQFTSITPLYQNQPGSAWAPGGFTNPTDSTKLLNSPSKKTIAQSGCILTDLTMALNYAGMSYNPLTLNNTLLAANQGFTGGDLFPSIATAAAAAASHQSAEWIDYNTSDPQTLRNELIQAATPIVVKVTNTTGNEHYVLVTGLAGNGDFTIDDPGYPSGTRKTLLNTYGSFTAQGYVIDPADLSLLSFAYVADGSGVNFTVTDPQGHLTTIDPTSGQSTQQIPNSFISVEGPLEDLSGGPAENTTAVIVDVYKPMAGTYEIQTGDQFASSTLTVTDVTPSGTVQSLPPQSGQSSGGQPLMQVFLPQASAALSNIDELGAYRPSDGSWSLDSNGTPGSFDSTTDQVFYNFSPPGVTGVAGDWNGNGISDIGDFSNGTWHLDLAGTGASPGANETFQFGQAGDIPVVGNWDGNPNGQDELGVFRNTGDGADGVGTGEFILDVANHRTMDSSNLVFSFGLATDHVIVGDWNGAGTSEVGVYRDAGSYIPADTGDIVFSINSNGDHQTFTNFVFGLITDKVVIGDWNGSGTSKVGTYRDGASFNAPGTALFSLDTNGSLMYQPGISEVFLYGLDSDQFLTGTWARTPPLQPEGTPGTVGSPGPTANPFAGTYVGTFSGSGTAFGVTEPISSGINGTIDSNGNITVTNPGNGSGTVSTTGVAHLMGTGTIDVANADYTFNGTFVEASDGAVTGSGTWSATFTGGSASGTWQVSRQ